MTKRLEEELKERLHTKRLDKLVASLSGACINNCHCYSIDDGTNVFVKTNKSLNARVMFDGELESLKCIEATRTIRVPKPITVMHNFDGKENSAFAMEFLDISSLTADSARTLGTELARLHDYNNKVIKFTQRASRWVGGKIPSTRQIMEKKAEDRLREDKMEEEKKEDYQFSKHNMRIKTDDRPQEPSDSSNVYTDRFVPEPNTEAVQEYGFSVATSCGAVPQNNQWSRDWVSFYARNRLDHTIRLILCDLSDRELNEQWSHLQLKVDKYFSDFEYKGTREGEIVPALLHGDLWSGNVAQLRDGSRGVVYDPASFYGHSEYDFGILQMFGGFPQEFQTAYFEELPKSKLFESRNKLYQLFHHLNHWNHFGSGYRASSLRMMKDLNQ